MSNVTLDPNFDPRHQALPDIPKEILIMQKNEKRKKIFVYAGISLLILAVMSVIIFLSTRNSSQYRYLMLQSTYTAASNDISPGADIQGIEINIKGLKFYPSKIIDSTVGKADILLNNPDNNITNASYASLGSKSDHIILKTNVDLKDPNLKSITVYEYTLGSLNEAYNIYISKNKYGPWELLKSGAGTTIYTP